MSAIMSGPTTERVSKHKVVEKADGLYTLEGIKGPMGDEVVMVDHQPTDTNDDKFDALMVELRELANRKRKVIHDGDVFDTPFGEAIVRGTLVVRNDANQTAMAAMQSSPPVQQQPSLSQIMGQIAGQLPPMGPAAHNPNPQVQQAGGPIVPNISQVMGTQAQGGLQTYKVQATDSSRASAVAHLQLNTAATPQEVADEWDNHINYVYGNSSIRSVISIPDGRRVIELEYMSGSHKVVLEIG